jgi:hypothetical protein
LRQFHFVKISGVTALNSLISFQTPSGSKRGILSRHPSLAEPR